MKLSALIKQLQAIADNATLQYQVDPEVVLHASKQEYDGGDYPHPGFYTTRSIKNSKLTSVDMETNVKSSSLNGTSKSVVVHLHGTDGN